MQCSAVQCSGGIFLLGGGNLTRSNFDYSENCYLVWGNYLLGGNQNLVVGGVYWGGEFFLVGRGEGGDEQIFS